MTIILFTKTGAKPIRLQLKKNQIRCWAAAVSCMLLVMISLGFWAGNGVSHQTEATAAIDAMKNELSARTQEFESLRHRTESHMNALALQLGKLQARSSRLEALGGRLVVLGQMDDGEFNFDSSPSMGGPESSEADLSFGRYDVSGELLALETRLETQAQQLSLLEIMIANRELEKTLEPAGRPVKRGWLSSGYGKRVDPVDGSADYHPGIDFSGNHGDEVVAVAGGVVTLTGHRYDYGNYIDIDHGNGYMTRYAHNRKNLVDIGTRVSAGEMIAEMGSTGRVTGPHVHFEVWYKGKRINPSSVVSHKLR